MTMMRMKSVTLERRLETRNFMMDPLFKGLCQHIEPGPK